MHSFPLLIFLLILPFQHILTNASTNHDLGESLITKSNGRTMATTSVVVDIVEHPVFFDMPSLLENATAEAKILEGLFDLQYNNYSDLYFLFTGKVLQNRGVPFTHALVSRFPSVDALQTYYDYALSDIALKMRPWLEREYCVDYQVSLHEGSARLPFTDGLAFHVTFIKVSSNTSNTVIDAAMDAFLALSNELDYVIQLTTVDALETLQQEPYFLNVLNDQILSIAESYVLVTFTPFTPKQMMRVM